MISLKDKPSQKSDAKYVHYDVTQSFIDEFQTGKTFFDKPITFYEIDDLKGKRGWTVSKPKSISQDDVAKLIKRVIDNDNKTSQTLVELLPMYDKALASNPKGMKNFEQVYVNISNAVAKRQNDITNDPTIKSKGTVDKLKSDLIAVKQKIWAKLGFSGIGELGEPITLVCVTIAFVALAGASVYITYKLNKEYTAKLTESDTQLKSAIALKTAIANLPIATEDKAKLLDSIVAVETEAKTKIVTANESGYNQGTTDAKTTIPTAIKWVAVALGVGAVAYAGVKLFGKDEKLVAIQPQKK